MTELVLAWDGWLTRLAQGPVFLIDAWVDRFNIPMMSALLFGLIGATAPCQLTTNLSALAFSARQAGRTGPLVASVAYVLGKVLVYSVVGRVGNSSGTLSQASSSSAAGAQARPKVSPRYAPDPRHATRVVDGDTALVTPRPRPARRARGSALR